MSKEHYKNSRRNTIYGSIYILKIISLCFTVLLTVIMIILDVREHVKHGGYSNSDAPLTSYVMLVAIIFFIISILVDFYILKKTTTIGNHLTSLAYIDKLTGLPNRYSCDLLFESFNNSEKLPNACFIVMKIKNLNMVNSNTDRQNGNFLIVEFCSILEEIGENYGYVGRNGGNEFIILLDNCDSAASDLFLADITKRIQGYNEMNVGAPMEISYARVFNSEFHADKMSQLISQGYRKLIEAPQTLS